MKKVLIEEEDYKVLTELVYLSGNAISVTDIIHKSLEQTVPKEIRDFILGKKGANNEQASEST